MKYFERKIALQFRTDLTAFLHKHYFENNTFYEMKRDSTLDCLDQRITGMNGNLSVLTWLADVEQFCRTLTFVYGHILKPVLDALFLSHSLGKLMGFQRLFLFFFYFFGMNQVPVSQNTINEKASIFYQAQLLSLSQRKAKTGGIL